MKKNFIYLMLALAVACGKKDEPTPEPPPEPGPLPPEPFPPDISPCGRGRPSSNNPASLEAASPA